MFGQFRYRIFNIFVIYIYDFFISSFMSFGVFDIGSDGFFDGDFDSMLSDEVQIGIGEVVSFGGDEVEVDIGGYRGFVELSFENVEMIRFIWQWYIDQRVEMIGMVQSRIKLFGFVGCINYEDVFFRGYVVYFCGLLVICLC